MKPMQGIPGSALAGPGALIPLASVLAVAGPLLTVSAGMWDAVSHLMREPEFFWSIQHMVVYTGVSITACAAITGSILVLRGQAGRLRRGILLIIAGSVIQIVSGYADSVSHDLFGIDGLVSWSHQPLEIGLVVASLGSILVIGRRAGTRLGRLLPLAITSFIFYVVWLGFNAALLPGHVLLCMPVYEIFSSGCAVL